MTRTGRPKKEPPADAAQQIRALAEDGWSLLGIANDLGTSADTLRRWLTEYPELQEQVDLGRENERRALHNMLYRQAMEAGNATAAMFLLKARHGYREGDQSETTNKVSITFQLPAALPMSDLKVIEHADADHRVEPVPAASLALTRTT